MNNIWMFVTVGCIAILVISVFALLARMVEHNKYLRELEEEYRLKVNAMCWDWYKKYRSAVFDIGVIVEKYERRIEEQSNLNITEDTNAFLEVQQEEAKKQEKILKESLRQAEGKETLDSFLCSFEEEAVE